MAHHSRPELPFGCRWHRRTAKRVRSFRLRQARCTALASVLDGHAGCLSRTARLRLAKSVQWQHRGRGSGNEQGHESALRSGKRSNSHDFPPKYTGRRFIAGIAGTFICRCTTSRPLAVACNCRRLSRDKIQNEFATIRRKGTTAAVSARAGNCPRNKLSDRFQRKSQNLPQIPDSFSKLPTFANSVRCLGGLWRHHPALGSRNSLAAMDLYLESGVLNFGHNLAQFANRQFFRRMRDKTTLIRPCKVFAPNSLTHFSRRTRMERLDRPQR